MQERFDTNIKELILGMQILLFRFPAYLLRLYTFFQHGAFYRRKR